MPYTSCSPMILPDELIIEIITYCHIEDAIRIGMTCKYMQILCDSTRTIWLSLLQNLDITQAPDIIPQQPVETLSTEDLRSKAIRAARKARAWKIPDAYQAAGTPTYGISPHIIADLYRDINEGAVTSWGELRAIPDGQHVLLENLGLLELWSLKPRTRKWVSRSPPGRPRSCFSFDFELQEGGKSLIITALSGEGNNNLLSVFKLDTRTWESELVLERAIPLIFLLEVMIRGELIMLHLTRNSRIMLMNWKTSSGLFIDLDELPNNMFGSSHIRVTLVANNYLFIAEATDVITLHAFPVSSVAAHWSQSSLFREWEHIRYSSPHGRLLSPFNLEVSRVLRIRLDGFRREADDGPCMLALHAFKPVWKTGGENVPIEIYVVSCNMVSERRDLLSYRVQLSRVVGSSTNEGNVLLDEASDGVCRLALVSQNRAETALIPWKLSNISNSGHIFSLHDTFECYMLFCDAPQPAHVFPLAPHFVPKGINKFSTNVTVEPTSGAVTIGAPGLLRVVQFE
ncbi:hypothetical protein EW145_g6649 [Phellinidium pouzarii]|uniref:F-box domain-containing protein n=1 Tax=Phellinidium pouzarii TaxID=167371 RepID=A0A4S4KW59_9AGAM|nr:hypothetical protein EW145_g6649 [Phellinidium pouzarii]